MIDTDFKYHS